MRDKNSGMHFDIYPSLKFIKMIRIGFGRKAFCLIRVFGHPDTITYFCSRFWKNPSAKTKFLFNSFIPD